MVNEFTVTLKNPILCVGVYADFFKKEEYCVPGH